MARKSELKNGAAHPRTVSARGVSKLQLSSERAIGLKLTLAAMDAIETEFAIESIADLEGVLERPSAKGLAKLVAIMARAAGETIEEAEILKSNVELPDLVTAIMGALTVNRGEEAEADLKNVPAPSA